ncbi:reverse transcriptase domain-containing protein [Tanacetum coccineum]
MDRGESTSPQSQGFSKTICLGYTLCAVLEYLRRNSYRTMGSNSVITRSKTGARELSISRVLVSLNTQRPMVWLARIIEYRRRFQKRAVDRHKGRWVEELSHVLWAHRTTIKVSTGDTPFSLVYGTEAVIPAEIGMPTIRTAEVNIATNDDEQRIDLDILEERRKTRRR